MHLNIQTSKDKFLRNYLELLNGILRLTPRELDSLVLFIEYDPEVACSMSARKHVAEAMNFKSVSVLNNYVKSLKDKRIIMKDNDGVYRYNGIVKPPESLDQLTFKFVFQDSKVSIGLWNPRPVCCIQLWSAYPEFARAARDRLREWLGGRGRCISINVRHLWLE